MSIRPLDCLLEPKSIVLLGGARSLGVEPKHAPTDADAVFFALKL